LRRGLEFGVASMFVHHQVRGKENIEIGQHHTYQGIGTEAATKEKHRPA
jgi:hypothetical protein